MPNESVLHSQQGSLELRNLQSKPSGNCRQISSTGLHVLTISLDLQMVKLMHRLISEIK